MSTAPNAAARIQAQTRQMQGKDIVCPSCGSNHFYEVQVTRYLGGGSGSVEIQADPNEQTHPLLICPCGEPILPKPAVGRRHGGVFETSHKLFRESVDKAIDYLKSTSVKTTLASFMSAVAGKDVEVKVANMDTRLSKIETDLTVPASKAPVEPAKPESPKTPPNVKSH